MSAPSCAFQRTHRTSQAIIIFQSVYLSPSSSSTFISLLLLPLLRVLPPGAADEADDEDEDDDEEDAAAEAEEISEEEEDATAARRSTLATFRNSLMCVTGHIICCQESGTMGLPARPSAETTPSSFLAVDK